jgi:biopolymer transport protein ExbD
MAFLRKGFLKSAHRRNELYCRIDLPLVAIIIFFPLLVIFMTLPHPYHGTGIDRIVARHIHKLPGARREDAIRVYVTRDGTFYFGSRRVDGAGLSDRIRNSIRDGAEKRIYLEVDARARYSDVSAVLSQIQLTGIQNVSFIADAPRPVASLSSHPTP